MLVRRLDITGVRNITHASLSPLSAINIIFGRNGAGKTSVLETVSLLATGKSFRGHKLTPLIQHGQDSCVAFGEINLAGQGFQPVGVERSRRDSANALIKVAGERIRSASVLAENLPMQVICADTFKLLEGAPAVRRQYLDWGVFHVEHQYYTLWKAARRCLKQRNHLLRHGKIDRQQLAVWTSEFADLGQRIDELRQQYIRQLKPVFEQTLAKLIDLDEVGLSYNRGWDKDLPLAEVLQQQATRDETQGFTGSGPHRADLRIRYQRANAADTLSRGQQKLVICALRVAQGYLLAQLVNKRCVYLIDDLPAELDGERRRALCELLEGLGSQVFITCVDPTDLRSCWSEAADMAMFHVEQGAVTRHTNEEQLDGLSL